MGQIRHCLIGHCHPTIERVVCLQIIGLQMVGVHMVSVHVIIVDMVSVQMVGDRLVCGHVVRLRGCPDDLVSI